MNTQLLLASSFTPPSVSLLPLGVNSGLDVVGSELRGGDKPDMHSRFDTECRSSEDVDRRMVGVAELDARPRMSSGVAPRQLQVDGPRSEASGLMTQNVETSVQVNNPVSDLTPSTSGQPTATGTSFITPGIANGPRYFLR